MAIGIATNSGFKNAKPNYLKRKKERKKANLNKSG
jgi:hypothetical protein